jgi:hypothetical protein
MPSDEQCRWLHGQIRIYQVVSRVAIIAAAGAQQSSARR